MDSGSASGTWDAWFADVVYITSSGQVTPLYTRQTSYPFAVIWGDSTSTRAYEINRDPAAGPYPTVTTTYYHGDHLGTSRVLTSENGYPVWSGTFLPFGAEFNPQATTNNYKFTGKERDSETGLDYFGARYYGSTMGRFLTPDWSIQPVSVPYGDFTDPQTLNLYGYTRNNPLNKIDKDGHCIDGVSTTACIVAVFAVATAAYATYKAIKQAVRDYKNARDYNEHYIDNVMKGRVNVDQAEEKRKELTAKATVSVVKAGVAVNSAINAVSEGAASSAAEAETTATAVTLKTAGAVADKTQEAMPEIVEMSASKVEHKNQGNKTQEEKKQSECAEDKCTEKRPK
jgi:RHS repeat-associated protein